MRFANLLAVMAAKGKKQYETARAVGMSESRFSRCLRGIQDFSFEEQQKIAQFLGRPGHWLFKQIRLPRDGAKKIAVPRAETGESKTAPAKVSHT